MCTDILLNVFIETAEKLDTYLFLFLTIFIFDNFVYFLSRNFQVLGYKVFFGRDMLNKYIMFSKSNIIV